MRIRDYGTKVDTRVGVTAEGQSPHGPQDAWYRPHFTGDCEQRNPISGGSTAVNFLEKVISNIAPRKGYRVARCFPEANPGVSVE